MKPLQACRIFLKRASDIKNSQLHARHGLLAAKKGAALAHVQNGRKSRQQTACCKVRRKGSCLCICVL